ncbi:hypothetical protein [Polaromonas aquatica]|uniref:hypothetical protein n=1 Tax=Polaromonas aquatica TaxID=332657 RepID=UPI0036734369
MILEMRSSRGSLRVVGRERGGGMGFRDESLVRGHRIMQQALQAHEWVPRPCEKALSFYVDAYDNLAYYFFARKETTETLLGRRF